MRAFTSLIAVLMLTVLVLVGCSERMDEPEVTEPVQETQEELAEAFDENEGVVDEACRLTVGFENWAPYQYMDIGQVVRGLDIEVAQHVTNRLDCALHAEQASWAELIDMLQHGEIDFLMGASRTEQREEYAWFSDPYRQEQFLLFVRYMDSRNYDMGSVESFVEAGYRVGVVNEYYYGEEIRDLIWSEAYESNFVGTIMGEINLARLMDDEIDGFLEDHLVGMTLIHRMGLQDWIVPHMEIALDASDVYIMFSKASVDESLVDRINDALAEMHETGAYQQIVERYTP